MKTLIILLSVVGISLTSCGPIQGPKINMPQTYITVSPAGYTSTYKCFCELSEGSIINDTNKVVGKVEQPY